MESLVDGRYELLEVIASGGMATVWRARDTRLDRLVALKRPHPGAVKDPVTRERMDREARAAAALNHPNVITVYDFGEDEGGPFLVMELVEGRTLAERSGEGDPATAVEMGSVLADALAAIHAAGIVHRDVKPANVILSDRGPLLTDFGIALSPSDAQLTDPGKIVATPSYAAPEVLAGNQPTPAADVYSLAVVIAEIATGRPLFNGFDRAVELPDLAGLEPVLGRALASSPEERPTAVQLADDLRGLAPTLVVPIQAAARSPEPTLVMSAPPPPPAPTTSPPPGRRGGGWQWVAAVLILLIALTLLAGRIGDPGMVGDPSLAATTSTTAGPTTTSTPTSTTQPPTTTADALAEARDRLAAILSRPPRDDLNPREAEDIMEKVDEAIAKAGEGKHDEAAQKLREAEKKIEDKLDDERRDEALAALYDIAELLGVDLGEDDD